MSKLLIKGQNRLEGEINIHGAKNSALPILAATILCSGDCILHNCPHLADVDSSIKILRYLGVKVKHENSALIVNSDELWRYDIPDMLMREMRSSIVFLGAILSRVGRASLSFPGGCDLGPRPIDIHLNALKELGIMIDEHHGLIDCHIDNKVLGTQISLSFPSVGATENILLASVLCEGTTIINNAAREPEICDLVNFLNSCGAKIFGAGEGTITIIGVQKLFGTEHRIIPDRIAASTFMAATAITSGDVLIKNILVEHLNSTIPIFEESGCEIISNETELRIIAPKKNKAIKVVRTMPYPGFPTDSQAIVMAMNTLSDGTSIFVENIFENRYKHVGELIRLGANIKVEGKVAIVEGVNCLLGASVEAYDLRGAAALIVAGLGSEGITQVSGLKHLDRGYEEIEKSLNSLGALIQRI